MTISDFIKKIKVSSSQKVLDDVFSKIEQTADYQAVINLTKERAYQRAKLVDEGQVKGRLAGVPFMAKDNFLAFGALTTAGSQALETFEAPYQATVIEKLEAEGAICVGKTNLDAFGQGSSTTQSFFGPTKNVLDKTRLAGGSSGGSAVAVALGLVPFALGSDTGGSVRQPASYNGVVGFKPTYGLISRFGLVSMVSGTDTVGVLAKNITDAELVTDCIAGQDQKDMMVLPDYFEKQFKVLKPLKIGLLVDDSSSKIQPEIIETVRNFSQKIIRVGHQVTEITLKTVKYAPAIYQIVSSAEISSNLARFDGVCYGYQSKDAKTLNDFYRQNRGQSFNLENKRRILFGSLVLSKDHYEKYYLKAQSARTLLINELTETFQQYDILISPVVTTAPPKKEASLGSSDYLESNLTMAVSLAGLPALSLPVGQDQDNLPIGVQLVARQQDDARLLAFAREMEEENV